MPHPTPFLCSRALVSPSRPHPPARIPGSPANYKFLLGKILFLNHETDTLYDAEIRNIPVHLVNVICSVFNLHGITLYYTISHPPVGRANPTPLANPPSIPADTLADILAP